MAVFIVIKIHKRESPYSDCRSIGRIEAVEYKGEKTIELSPEEAFDLVTRGSDRLWARSGQGFVPVVPAIKGEMRYVRTEPVDTSSDVLMR